jgi:hypothetical protein
MYSHGIYHVQSIESSWKIWNFKNVQTAGLTAPLLASSTRKNGSVERHEIRPEACDYDKL